MVLRLATPADLPGIAAIYNHEIRTGIATWRLEPVDLAERAAWLATHDPERHPVVVADLGGEIAGWASLSPFYPGSGGWASTVECSVYVAEGRRGQGLGRALLAELCRRGGEAGHRAGLAVIAAENTGSQAMCRAEGFFEVGRLPGVGRKFGRTLDCVLLERWLRSRAGAVIRDGAGRVLLVRRHRDGGTWWVLPGGGLEAGETAQQAACREVREETGLEVRLGALGYRVLFRGRTELYFAGEPTGPAGVPNRPEFAPGAAAHRGTYPPEWLTPPEIAARPCYPPEIAQALASGAPWPETPVTIRQDPGA